MIGCRLFLHPDLQVLCCILYGILRKFWFDQSKCSVLTSIYNIYLVRLCVTEYIKIMSEKFHLYTCIFRIHRFKSEFFGTYDFNLAVIFNIIFGVKEFLFEVTAFLFTCYQFIFVFTKLTFDDFFYKINTYISELSCSERTRPPFTGIVTSIF